MKVKLLRKICNFVLCVALVFSVVSLDTNYVYADGKGDQTSTGEGDTNASAGTTDWATSWSIVYKVSFVTENYPLSEEGLKKEGLFDAFNIKYKTLTYYPSWTVPLLSHNYINDLTDGVKLNDETKPFGLINGFDSDRSYAKESIEGVLNDSFSDYFLIVDDTKSDKLFTKNTSVGGGVNNLKSSKTIYDGDKNKNRPAEKGGCRSIRKASDLIKNPIFGISSGTDAFDEMLRVSSSGQDYSGFSASCDTSKKDEVLRAISSFGGISYNSADCDKTLILVERCILCNYRSGTPSNSIKKGSAGTGYDMAGLVTWRNLCAQYGNTKHQAFTQSTHDGVSFRISDIVCPSLDSGANGGKFYVGQTYAPVDGTNSLVHTVASSIQNNHGDLVPWGNLATWGKGYHSDVSGFFLYGYAGGDPAPNDATNTLAIYDDIPVKGKTVSSDDAAWNVSSSIVDGAMPDLVEGDFSEIKYYDTTTHMWVTPDNNNKPFGKLIDAVKGGTPLSDADFVNGDQKVYALVARDSYKTLNIFDQQKFDTVLKTNGTVKSEVSLDKPPTSLTWGGLTVKELTGEDASFGDVITIENINGSDYKTSGLKAYAETDLGLVGAEQKRGELDSTKTVMTQIKNEIESAMTLSGGDNYEGTGASTKFTTSITTLGSAVEILVKAAPVTSNLHVISVSNGVSTYVPDVADYEYTNVDWGISKPKEDSGVEKVVAIGVALKDTSDGSSIAGKLTGLVDEDSIKITFLSEFENKFDSDVPKINVGNEENVGYDIYVLTTDSFTVSSESVELPDYLLNLYYNRIMFYTNSGGSEYKVNWDQHTFPQNYDDMKDTVGEPNRVCYWRTFTPDCAQPDCSYQDSTGHGNDNCTDRTSTNEHMNNPCENFYVRADVETAYNSGSRFWEVQYHDSTDVSKSISMGWEDEKGQSGIYFLKANYAGADTSGNTSIWANSKISALRGDGKWAKINTGSSFNTDASDGRNYLFDYAFNLTRSSNGDRRTLSGIGYSSISDSPRDNFLQLEFGVKPDESTMIKLTDTKDLNNSNAYVPDKKESIRITSTFVHGGTTNESGNNGINDWRDAPALNRSVMECVHKEPADHSCSKDEAHEGENKHEGDCEPYKTCTGVEHKIGSLAVVCKTSDNLSKVTPNGAAGNADSTVGTPVLGFINHYGSSDKVGTIMSDSGQEFTKRVYKYQTKSGTPSGAGNAMKNPKVKNTVYESSKVPAEGDITDSNIYRLAYVKDNGIALKFYPEVKMGYYSVNSEDFPSVAVGGSYMGRNLTKKASELNSALENSGAVFDAGTADTLYTMGEEMRSVQSSSLYLYRIKSTKDKTVTGKTFSTGALSSTKTGGSTLINIPAGSDISVNAEPDGMEIDLYGYSLDIINTTDKPIDASGTAKAYTEYVKSGIDVAEEWGDTNNKTKLQEQFTSWAGEMLNPKKYNADFILTEVNTDSGSKVYNNFSAAVGNITGGTGLTDDEKCYIIKVEHGVLDESFSGYKALIKQLKLDYGLTTDGEAKSLFWGSGIPQAIIDSMETEKNDVNKSYGNARLRGDSGQILGVHSSHQGKLGSSDHWYDEMTRTFVVRRYASTGHQISNVTLQDKLDFGSAGNTAYGKNSNKRGNTGITGGASWYLSIYLTDSGLAGGDTAICGLEDSMYLPRDNGGSSYKAIRDKQESYVEKHQFIVWNAPVNGAEFNIPSSTTSNFGD